MSVYTKNPVQCQVQYHYGIMIGRDLQSWNIRCPFAIYCFQQYST